MARVSDPFKMLGALIGRPVASEAVRRYERLLRQRAASVSVYPGVDPVLRALQGRVPLAVFTAADTAAAEILLEATGIRRFFAHVVGADRVSQTKPSPEGLLLMARLLLVEPTRMAYIGDGPADIAAARACGALAVAAAWGHQFDAIVPADQVLEQPADVLRFIRMAPLAASAVPLDLVSELDSDGDSHDGGSG